MLRRACDARNGERTTHLRNRGPVSILESGCDRILLGFSAELGRQRSCRGPRCRRASSPRHSESQRNLSRWLPSCGDAHFLWPSVGSESTQMRRISTANSARSRAHLSRFHHRVLGKCREHSRPKSVKPKRICFRDSAANGRRIRS